MNDQRNRSAQWSFMRPNQCHRSAILCAGLGNYQRLTPLAIECHGSAVQNRFAHSRSAFQAEERSESFTVTNDSANEGCHGSAVQNRFALSRSAFQAEERRNQFTVASDSANVVSGRSSRSSSTGLEEYCANYESIRSSIMCAMSSIFTRSWVRESRSRMVTVWSCSVWPSTVTQ